MTANKVVVALWSRMRRQMILATVLREYAAFGASRLGHLAVIVSGAGQQPRPSPGRTGQRTSRMPRIDHIYIHHRILKSSCGHVYHYPLGIVDESDRSLA